MCVCGTHVCSFFYERLAGFYIIFNFFPILGALRESSDARLWTLGTAALLLPSLRHACALSFPFFPRISAALSLRTFSFIPSHPIPRSINQSLPPCHSTIPSHNTGTTFFHLSAAPPTPLFLSHPHTFFRNPSHVQTYTYNIPQCQMKRIRSCTAVASRPCSGEHGSCITTTAPEYVQFVQCYFHFILRLLYPCRLSRPR